jgi:hypothetical protein
MVVSARARFYLEAILATLATALFVLTLVTRDWIEVLFKVDPDEGNGSLEWLVVIVLAVVAIALIALARRDWRKANSSMA